MTGRPNGSMATKVFSRRPGDTSQSAPKFCAGEGGTRDVRDVPGEILWRVVVKPYKNHTKTHGKLKRYTWFAFFFSRNDVFYVYIIGTHWWIKIDCWLTRDQYGDLSSSKQKIWKTMGKPLVRNYQHAWCFSIMCCKHWQRFYLRDPTGIDLH